MNKQNFLIAFILLGTFILLATMLAKGQSTTPGTKINISGLTAYEKNNRLFIEWAADAGTESNYWEVQGSADGKKFSTIAILLGSDPAKAGEQYTFKGKITRPGDVFYKVVHISLTGMNQQDSKIIQLVK